MRCNNAGIANPYTSYGRIANPTGQDNTCGSGHKYRLLSSFIFIYLLLSSLVSCTGNTLYHSYQSLPVEGWERRDTVCFEVPKAEEDISGTLFIGLRTVAHVGIQDVVLAVEQCDEMGAVCRCDTVRYPLTDTEGNALAGGVNIHQYETKHLPLLLRKGNSTTIRIHHLMRHETLSGLTELGIRIEAP